MNTVTFQNDGYLDPVSIMTFGVNAKESDNPIGYFGTGLKYAIAVLVREGCEIIIQSGIERHDISVQKKAIRGKEFELVTINGEPCGFTTELGKNWKVWQAFRELYCNALDEDGEVFDGTVKHSKKKTTITVKGEKFYNAYLERGSVILGSTPMITSKTCDIHSGANRHVFYKRVRIYTPQKHFANTYDIKAGLDISEDRTALYEFQIRRRIVEAIVSSHDERLIESTLLTSKNHFESDINYDDSTEMPSQAFIDTAMRLRLDPRVNLSIMGVLAKRGKIPPPPSAKLNDIQEKQLKKAISFCKSIGYQVDRFPIIVTAELKSGYTGLAEDDQIYLSMDVFGMGTKYVASTLIEEYLHLHTGYNDCTREMQNHLFNDIVSLGEQITGEPV